MFRFGLVIATFVLFAMSVARPIEAQTNCSVTPSSLADPLVNNMWRTIMDARAAVGEDAFTWSPNLARSSAWMARDAAQRQAPFTVIDSLGRDVRTRLTDCGYRADAQVAETITRVITTDTVTILRLWKSADTARMYGILYSPVLYPPTYTVGALAYARGSFGEYYWILDVGTLPDVGVATATPIPSSTPVPTAIPPTATVTPTSVPTAIPTATPTPDAPTLSNCFADGDWPGPIDWYCD